ncbi:hypothetical protein E2C01_046331 [Portunus trituberculatus]|uniref:Uncharacterized protein n=1 Tax=Portunus trituberculatus TaxID=210409 RepID=A0A5B7FY67_PORTR|nr:hypothetical protein [Portunus trituberculatus]
MQGHAPTMLATPLALTSPHLINTPFTTPRPHPAIPFLPSTHHHHHHHHHITSKLIHHTTLFTVAQDLDLGSLEEEEEEKE